MGIPATLLYDLERIPRDRAVTLIMRHSARFPIIPPDLGFGVGLTEEGVRLAEATGMVLGQTFSAGRLLAAPVGRCLDTANAIARGAGWPENAAAEERISHPYIEPDWDMLNRGALNGVLPPRVRGTLALLLEHPRLPEPRLDVMVTHDTIVSTLVGCVLHQPYRGPDYWPEFLEGIFLWWEEKQVHTRWRGIERVYQLAQDSLIVIAG